MSPEAAPSTSSPVTTGREACSHNTPQGLTRADRSPGFTQPTTGPRDHTAGLPSWPAVPSAWLPASSVGQPLKPQSG